MERFYEQLVVASAAGQLLALAKADRPRRWGIRDDFAIGWPEDHLAAGWLYPGILGTLFRRSAPELSAQPMQMCKEGGSDLSGGMGVPLAAFTGCMYQPMT